MLRSDLPDATVLAFEGDDDKIVYGQWIRRIRPELRYEPFPCGGKKGVKELKNALIRDLNRLGENIFFLVDRDYDDLRGFENADRVFMTDAYAVENYLVTDEVLDELLRDEFPCHTRPDLRRDIVQMFSKDYADFLKITASINKRLFIARRVTIELSKQLPEGLRYLATVRVGNICAVPTPPDEIVVYKREPTVEETAGLDEAFDQLEPRMRYRGKFAIKFFQEWIRNLADGFVNSRGVFSNVKLEGGIRRAEFVLSNFASKSRIPTGLPAFVNAMAPIEGIQLSNNTDPFRLAEVAGEY